MSVPLCHRFRFYMMKRMATCVQKVVSDRAASTEFVARPGLTGASVCLPIASKMPASEQAAETANSKRHLVAQALLPARFLLPQSSMHCQESLYYSTLTANCEDAGFNNHSQHLSEHWRTRSSPKKPVWKQVSESYECFPTGRCAGQSPVETRIQHQRLSRRVTHCPKIPNSMAAEEWLGKMPDFA